MKVVLYPHQILKYTSKPVLTINKELRAIVEEMFQTMYDTAGVGLAANQVGLPLRLFVMNPTGEPEKKEEERVLINPVILKKSGKVLGNEGCLSYPGIYADVVRSDSIELESIDLTGELRHDSLKGHPARVVQHETDHLNGIGFIDRLSPTALTAIREELDELLTIYQGELERKFVPTDEELAAQIEEWEQKFCR